MQKFSLSSLWVAAVAACVLMLSACSPTYDWREVHGEAAPFTVLLPAKPATFSRKIDLDGTPATMTMTAAEVDDVTFAVGSAELPDAAKAQASLNAMKTALVKNIGGEIRQEKTLTMPRGSDAAAGQLAVIEVEARGMPSAATRGEPRMLFARFVAKDKQVYQVVVLGREKDVTRDTVDTFFASFKLN